MSIKIQVATCTQCNGYYSAAPLEQKHTHHPEIIDHFFYHGEPWFTLDQKAFEKFTNHEKIKVIIIDLHTHIQHDHLYCRCEKKTAPTKINYTYEVSDFQKPLSILEKNEIENEIYFKDLYYTYNNFHGIVAATHHGSSVVKFR